MVYIVGVYILKFPGLRIIQILCGFCSQIQVYFFWGYYEFKKYILEKKILPSVHVNVSTICVYQLRN